ncbi:MAG: hypothetical protein ACK2UK_22755 [Candidatus Promineifilaceae bacterium]
MPSIERLVRRLPWWVWALVLLLVPILLTLAWGDLLSDAAYLLLLAARDLRGALDPAFGGGQVTGAPLFALLLAAAGSWAPQAALLAGALGWGAAAVAVSLSLRAAGRPWAATIAALLLIANPLFLRTAGTAWPWAAALGWAAAALVLLRLPPPAALRKPWLLTLLLFMLLGLHFSAVTILFALSLLAIARYKERAGWLPFFLLAVAALLWGVWAIPRYGPPPQADPAYWWRWVTFTLRVYPLVWLYLPFVLLGLWDIWQGASMPAWSKSRPFFALLFLWALTAVSALDTAAPLLLTVLLLALAALGVSWLARRLLSGNRLTLENRRAPWLVPALLAAPLLLVACSHLWLIFAARPLEQARLQEKTAVWLSENAAAEAVLYAPPRVGYYAGRVTLPAMVEHIRAQNVAAEYDRLLAWSPDVIVSERAPDWDAITRTGWFGDHYVAEQHFEDGYALNSPVTVWTHTTLPGEEQGLQPIRAVVDDRFALVGYTFEPAVIAPGDDVYLTLYLEALRPVEQGFITGVHLTAADGWVWAWREERTPRSFSGQWWAPGQVIPERIRLQTTADIPLAAYDLQLFWRAADSKSNWPIVRDGDLLDLLYLGHVIAPPAVDPSQGTPVGAQFGDGIMLDAMETSVAKAGEALDVTLYWQALSQPTEDYTVFVHLLDEAGEIVAAHDGMPAGGQFPTSAWRPGIPVADSHSLSLPPDLAPGTYRLTAGLYLLETGERLPVRAADGTEPADRSLPLTTLKIDR